MSGVGAEETPAPVDPYTCHLDDLMKNFSRFRVLTMLCWYSHAVAAAIGAHSVAMPPGGMWYGVRCTSVTLTIARLR